MSVPTPTTHRAAAVELSVGAPPRLAAFNAAGVLHAADVHVATTLARLVGEDDPGVLLAAALTARAPRIGHVCVELSRVATNVAPDVEDPSGLAGLDWPDPRGWLETVAASPLVRTADTDEVVSADAPPLVLSGDRLYLDRWFRHEQRVAAAVGARSVDVAVDPTVLATACAELFDGAAPDRQRLAAAVAATRQLSVVAGGPGTGKTHTVARLLGVLDRLAVAAGAGVPRVALAAPTGKAADRLTSALHEAAADPALDEATRDRLETATASTLHRLLGHRRDNPTRFRHDAANPLPHDVVVVDEASMISLSLMARLLAALRDDARLVLVGDPNQLVSVEAGAVLGDVVGPSLTGMRFATSAHERLAPVVGDDLDGVGVADRGGVGDGIVVLDRVHRFPVTSPIARLAAAVQTGDVETAVEVLRAGGDQLTWIEPGEPDATEATAPAQVRTAIVAAGRDVHTAATAGDAIAALAAVNRVRVLCGHRHGPGGVHHWVGRITGWLDTEIAGHASHQRWYVGRPVLVTANDHRLGVYNGDIGVTVADGDRLVVAFDQGGGLPPRMVAPSRLDAVETVHAMTIHKSQGSQFEQVVVVLPRADSPLATRELVYTALTRARRAVTVLGGEAALRAAIERPVQRASGLGPALWPGD